MQIQKRDGSLEDFDQSKISSGLVKAGATLDQAETIASQAVTWAQGAAVEGVLRASEVKTKVVELLQAANPEAAVVFEAFRKPE